MAPPTQFRGHYNATTLFEVICTALAGYNACELILLIFTTFNVYRGLYFWAMTIGTVSIFPYIIGMEIVYFAPSSKLAGLIINNVGWIVMVVSQSVVLYSRLGIILGDPKSKILVYVLWLIIVDAIVFYSIATVIVFGMQYSSNRNFDAGYIYSERIQMTGFCCQEFLISGIYVWKTLDILNTGEKKQARRTLWQLLIINLVIVALDVALLVLEYLYLASIEIAFKALAYSVKLKLEFAILNKLVESSGMAQKSMTMAFHNSIAADAEKNREALKDYAGRSGSGSHPMLESTPPTLRTWENNDDIDEKTSREHIERGSKSHESLRATSHQTECSQRQLLNGTQFLNGFPPRNIQSDEYHDMIRTISRI